MIDRPRYYDQIRQFIDTPFIKILTGVRRSGKSTMLLLIQEIIKEQGVAEDHIISMNFESMQLADLRDSHSLYTSLSQKLGMLKGKTYLFFDEIQIVESWEEVINSLNLDYSCDIYITGSNSQLLSSELSTLLTGRYIHIPMYVLSFSEMLQFRSEDRKKQTDEELLWLFIRRGGFPAVHLSHYDEKATYMIVSDIYDSIVLRDVVQRYNIRNVDLLHRIMHFLMDTLGSPVSAKKISDYFKSQHRAVDINTIYSYLDALVNSFIIHKVQRYDIQGKELLKTQEKYYLADQGIQHAVLGYRDRHISGILENIVFLELVGRGYRVSIGKLENLEIDFVAENTKTRLYVQVAYQLNLEKTVAREAAPLLAIRDAYPKFDVTMDTRFQDTIEGIRYVSLLQFLTDVYLF